jgi:hypothetical protein
MRPRVGGAAAHRPPNSLKPLARTPLRSRWDFSSGPRSSRPAAVYEPTGPFPDRSRPQAAPFRHERQRTAPPGRPSKTGHPERSEGPRSLPTGDARAERGAPFSERSEEARPSQAAIPPRGPPCSIHGGRAGVARACPGHVRNGVASRPPSMPGRWAKRRRAEARRRRAPPTRSGNRKRQLEGSREARNTSHRCPRAKVDVLRVVSRAVAKATDSESTRE